MSLNVDSLEFEATWARVEGWLAEALERSGCIETMDDVKRAVVAGSCQLFHHDSGAGVTLIDRNERVRTLRIWLMGGTMEAAEAMLPMTEVFARAAGCERIAFLGRTGWQRTFLTDEGFKAVAVDMVKTLVPLEVPDGQANDH